MIVCNFCGIINFELKYYDEINNVIFDNLIGFVVGIF